MNSLSLDNGVRILLAEDNMVNQLLIKKVIEKSDYYLEIASDGIQVLDKLKHSQYHLILMDIQMPGMNGLDTTKEIIKLYQNRPVIIAITAGSFGDDEANCILAGMDDVLDKPFKLEQLQEKLKKFNLI